MPSTLWNRSFGYPESNLLRDVYIADIVNKEKKEERGSKERAAGMGSSEDEETEEREKTKASLAIHGYIVGKTLGTGGYSTVK